MYSPYLCGYKCILLRTNFLQNKLYLLQSLFNSLPLMAFLSSSKVSWLLCNSYTYGLAPTISLLYSFSSKVYGYGNKTKSSCGNFNIGFTIKCEVQGPMRLRVCLGVKHTFTIGGRMQRMKPNDSQVHPHFGSYICLRVVILEFSFGSPREK